MSESARTSPKAAKPLIRFAFGLALAGLALAAVAQEYTNVATLGRLATNQTRINTSSLAAAKKWAAKLGIPTKVVRPNGSIILLSGFKFGRPMYVGTTNVEAALTVGVTDLWPGGISSLNLTGGGMVMGIWEAGAVPEIGHQELSGRITVADGSQDTSDHATHVAGTMIASGVNPQAKGMSYAARLLAYDANNDTGEMANSAANGLPLSNHSYTFWAGWLEGGLGDGKWVWMGDPLISKVEDYKFGWYSGESVIIDTVCYNAPFYLPVFGAGNFRNGAPAQPVEHYVWDAEAGEYVLSSDVRYGQETYDTIAHGGQNAKNTLTIGAVETISGGYLDPSQVILASFSSWGPADDGRVKPDLVAPGVDIFSSTNGGRYDWYSGTSMAGPVTTGSLGLIAQLYKEVSNGDTIRASTLKAIAIHTANPAQPFPGPSYDMGWGLLNAAGAAEVLKSGLLGGGDHMVVEHTLNSRQTIDIPFTITNDDPIKATICWTDPPGGAIAPALDSRSRALVNDVDIRIIHNASGMIFEPFVLDPDNPENPATVGDNRVDPVEQVLIEAPLIGQYTARITAKGNLRPSGTQLVSFVLSGALPNELIGFVVQPDVLIGGLENATATLTAAAVNATQDRIINLTTNRPSVVSIPATVTIRRGELSVDFSVITNSVRPVDSDRSVVRLDAYSEYGGISTSFEVLPVTVQDLTLSSYDCVGGAVVTGRVWLNSPAPKYGAAVTLETSLPRVARSVRNWVLIPAGQTSAPFTIRTFAVSDRTPVMIRARRLGTVIEPLDEFGDSRPLIVNKPNLSELSLSPSTVTGGNSVTLTATLDGPAPTGGATVQLASSNRTVLAAPQTISIGAGRKSGSVAVASSRVSGTTTVTVTATRSGVSKGANVQIRP